MAYTLKQDDDDDDDDVIGIRLTLIAPCTNQIPGSVAMKFSLALRRVSP